MESIKQLLVNFSTDMEIRGMSAHTQRSYTQHVERFLRFRKRPAEEIDESEAREFLIEMLRENKVSTVTLNSYNAAIRLFFAVTLNRTMNYLQLPRFKVKKKLPEILSREEIRQLTDKCANVKHKSFLMLAYGSGLRVSEISRLRINDIDSKAMRAFVKDGKGGKDRYTILSNECLCVLREYWTVYRPKHPDGWLFPGVKNVTHISSDAIECAFNNQLEKAGITKNVSIHTLRHCFATHLLEDGVDLFRIKELLGHSSLNTTTVYLHLANTASGITSPADRFEV
jgi:site-specific recombinase XerD